MRVGALELRFEGLSIVLSSPRNAHLAGQIQSTVMWRVNCFYPVSTRPVDIPVEKSVDVPTRCKGRRRRRGPSGLVQHLAVFGVRSVDEVADRLWPDADAMTARRRLRNLLNRTRTECGGIIERSGTRLRLTPRADVDLAEFQRTVALAAAAPPAERSGLARVAIARATGSLLADVDDDELAVVRERVRRQVVDLLDVVAADAVARADHAEATRLLENAVTLEPMEESRYVVLANLLLDLGRPRSANDVVNRGLAVATDLDVVPSPELTRLAERLVDIV